MANAHDDAMPWEKPDWMLLSYGKPATKSSGDGDEHITDENVRTWWRAASNESGQWAQVDLGMAQKVHAVQINFADDGLVVPLQKETVFYGDTDQRAIEQSGHVTRWCLEGSLDGDTYFAIANKSHADTDLPHDLVVNEEGVPCRYVRITVHELPYGQTPCISGLRAFGRSQGALPKQANVTETKRISELDVQVRWADDGATGHNILWGHAPDKLYHSCMVYGKSEYRIAALVKGQPTYIRVDAFNECGITEGNIIREGA